MARADKAAAVAEIAVEFREASGTVLTEYRGLTVGQLKQLRRSLGGETTFAVVKNTLTKIAASEAGVDGIDDLLAGPTAIAFVKGDFLAAAKALDTFAKENPLLVIKGGIFDGKVLTPAEVKKLATLESREVLLAKVAGMVNAAMAKAAATIDALRIKLEAEQGAPAVVEAPVAQEASAAQTEEAPAEEAAAEEAPAQEAAEEPAAEAAAEAEPTEG